MIKYLAVWPIGVYRNEINNLKSGGYIRNCSISSFRSQGAAVTTDKLSPVSPLPPHHTMKHWIRWQTSGQSSVEQGRTEGLTRAAGCTSRRVQASKLMAFNKSHDYKNVDLLLVRTITVHKFLLKFRNIMRMHN